MKVLKYAVAGYVGASALRAYLMTKNDFSINNLIKNTFEVMTNPKYLLDWNDIPIAVMPSGDSRSIVATETDYIPPVGNSQYDKRHRHYKENMPVDY